ncbi:MAG: glycosyltransferase, partial [Bacteroidota bacterium]
MASDALVIVPTYNEKENITAFLIKILGLAYPFEILVVDDGSPDGTGAIA